MAALKFSDVERKMDVKCAKIKIMHLCSYIGYDGPSRGIMGQAKYTDRERFHTTICEIKPSQNKELIENIINMGCSHLSLNIKKAYNIGAIFKLAKVLRVNKIDILNTHNTLPCWYGNIAARIAKIPVVFTLRNLQSENYKFLFKRSFYYKPINFIDCWSMKCSDRVVAVSQRLKKYYVERMRIPQEKISVIKNAIDFSSVGLDLCKEKAKNNLCIGSSEVVIGIIGDLVKRKNHACLIEAANIVVKTCAQVRFLVVGEGPLKVALLKNIATFGLDDKFIFTGHTKNVKSFLSAIDIFVMPSFAEGISRALMESMAMGIVSVGSAIDGNLEAIEDGKTGFIFESDNHAALAEKLVFLIKNQKARQAMGQEAKQKAEREFDMEKAADAYEDLYLEVITLHKQKAK
ncbi:MAG: glycosyltransferase [Candidatus Omnitrophica bacterium]|nr:glycosyltransferase [Candidatus Omnitrophota bacterium]